MGMRIGAEKLAASLDLWSKPEADTKVVARSPANVDDVNLQHATSLLYRCLISKKFAHLALNLPQLGE